ncbi:MAG: adaptor protein MecA [Lachnospiraceae bacterium]|nr:adaptor protein MecA [Lachnospiraceae bacterium]
MKFEKINENQIRCTLNKADLADRDLLIHELAYGTPKAKELFREMMQQASYEVGFEAEDIPLMIEAIPVSPDCLVLIITKVEDPEELDTRFSKFTKPHSFELPGEDEDSPHDEDEEDITTIYDQSEDSPSIPFGPNGAISDALNLLAPITNAIKHAQDVASANKEKVSEEREVQKVFLFKDMKMLMELAPKLHSIYKEENSLYKDQKNQEYYLFLNKGNSDPVKFKQICNLLSEYGKRVSYTYASTSYYKEHFDTIVEKKAIKVLAGL